MTQHVGARVPLNLAKKVKQESARVPRGKSAILRAALEEFFENHSTIESMIQATARSHARKAA